MEFARLAHYFEKLEKTSSRLALMATLVELFRAIDSPPDADGWHTDVSWVAEPPAYAVLNAKVIPPTGGDTMWSSLFAAYDALSPVMRGICDRLTVRRARAGPFRPREIRGLARRHHR